MNKLTLLIPLLLPACVSPQQFAAERAHTLGYAEGVCQGRGIASDSADYRKCLQDVGKRYGYGQAAGDRLAFVVPQDSGKGPIGGGTFYPATYVPPVNAYR